MPVKLIHEAAVEADDNDLLTTNGELTLEAETVSDFLTHADFSAVFAHPAVAENISTIEDGKIAFGKNVDQEAHRAAMSMDESDDGDEGAWQVISLEDALRVIDENDLEQMFLHYVDSLPEDTLEDRARRAAIANAYGLDEFKKGAFKKIRARGKPGMALVQRMLGAMKQKGLIKRAADAGSGYTGGDWTKTPQYKTGPKKAVKAKIAKFKKANVAKLKKAAAAAKAAKKKGPKMKKESVGNYEDFDVTNLPLFGLSVPMDGAAFEVSTVGAANVGESTEGSAPAKAAVLSEGARLAAGMNRVGQRLNG